MNARERLRAVVDGEPPKESTAPLLEAVEAFLRRFVVFADSSQATAVTLWLAHTHALGAAEVTPYLNVESAEKRSGKSRLLELLGALGRDSLHVANLSEAALFRSLGSEPTLLIDEVDALFAAGVERTEALRGVLNAGNRRGVDVIRCTGPNHAPTPFKVFSAKVVAGIDTGRLPDTLRDRSITLRLKRKVAAERVERLLWPRVRPSAEALRTRLAAWGEHHVDDLAALEPDLPTELDDRAAEAWWALLAIADLAGDEWPNRARAAAKALRAADAAGDESRKVQMLSDVRAAFGPDLTVFTRALLDRLNGLEEAPWGAWHEGKGMRPRDLARQLRPFGIHSKKVKIGGENAQGYHRDDLEDAWARYLSEGPVPDPATKTEPPEPMEPSRVYRGFEVPFCAEVPEPQTKTEPETPLAEPKVPEVPEVPFLWPEVPEPADSASDDEADEALTEHQADLLERFGDGAS